VCGIAGGFGTGPLADRERIARASRLLATRGPDGEGFKEFHFGDRGGAFLLHRLLKIQDLTNLSSQPMEFPSGVLAYNGEIYNFQALRSELEANGVQFRTSGDTEVVGAAIDYWGLDAIRRFDGMWALAWLDRMSEPCLFREILSVRSPSFFVR